MSSCWVLYAVWNCWRTPWPIGHFAAVCRPLLVESIWVILFVPALVNNWSLSVRWLQKSSTWRTDCVGHPQVQYGVVFGTWMLASHAFSPRISVHSKNAAVDSAFVCPLYRGRVAFDHGVLHMVALYALTAFFQRCFYSLSAYLAMHIVDLHLYWWPPILYCRSGALPARRWFSAWCCMSSRISCSFFVACRRRVSWLVSLGVVPL